VLPFYIRTILPAAMRDGPVLLVAHGNSIRALAMALDGLTPEEVPRLEIATGETLIYRLAPDTSVAEKQVRRLAELDSEDSRIAP
jgi:2,3-bisphosphoglycerate-dependent phosphoglycerate mutase